MIRATGKTPAPEGAALSEREREVARLVLEGKTTGRSAPRSLFRRARQNTTLRGSAGG